MTRPQLGSLDSDSYTVGIVVDGRYTRNSPVGNTVVTVSRPLDSFITGGGYLLMDNSADQVPGEDGTKTSFGFNVKYNCSRTSLQGKVNVIIRNGGRVYQIKSNAINSLAIDTKAPNKATFDGRANIQDVPDPTNPISVDSNAALQLTLTDNVEPGATDTTGITLWNKSGSIRLSSERNGTRTIEQTLDGGNLVVCQ